MVKVKGSYVVETAYLMPLILLIWVSCIYALFYYHDKRIISGTAYEAAVVGREQYYLEERLQEGIVESYFQDRIKGKLLFYRTVNFEEEVKGKYLEIRCEAKQKGMEIKMERRISLNIVEPELRMRQRIERW